jgi:hypothetical protein
MKQKKPPEWAATLENIIGYWELGILRLGLLRRPELVERAPRNDRGDFFWLLAVGFWL